MRNGGGNYMCQLDTAAAASSNHQKNSHLIACCSHFEQSSLCNQQTGALCSPTLIQSAHTFFSFCPAAHDKAACKIGEEERGKDIGMTLLATLTPKVIENGDLAAQEVVGTTSKEQLPVSPIACFYQLRANPEGFKAHSKIVLRVLTKEEHVQIHASRAEWPDV